MSVLRRMFSTRASRVHLFFFLILGITTVTIDLVQGVDTESAFLNLDWAHVLMFIWFPIFATHAIFTWWGGEVDELDDHTR